MSPPGPITQWTSEAALHSHLQRKTKDVPSFGLCLSGIEQKGGRSSVEPRESGVPNSSWKALP